MLLGALLAGAVAGRGLLQAWVGEPWSGLSFAAVLLAASLWQRPELGHARTRALLLGLGVGAGLLLPGAWLRLGGVPPRGALIPGSTLALYSAALFIIAPAEEIFLRGMVQPLLRRTLGPGAAITVVAMVFAAVHVPAYGPAAVPLDLGVGLLLGWLRERTGSVAPCAVAHLTADLASWWLA